MILCVRTDKPDAELYIYDSDGKEQAKKVWTAHRQLADTLLGEIEVIIDGKWDDLSGIVAFQGPGSFTGLRIGITTANAIAHSQKIPIVGEMDDDWIVSGLQRLANGVNDTIVLPEYGADPRITAQRK